MLEIQTINFIDKEEDSILSVKDVILKEDDFYYYMLDIRLSKRRYTKQLEIF